MNPTALLIVLLLAGGTAALFRVLLKHGAERTARQYRLLAGFLGVEPSIPVPRAAGFIRGEPSLYGRWRGREISVSVPGKGLQNTRQVETVLKMELRLRGFRLQATAAGLLGRLRQRDSGLKERWTSGDPAFDRAVDLRTSDPARASKVLGPALRSRMAELLAGGKASIHIDDGLLAFTEFGLIADEAARERFQKVAVLLEEIAEGLESDA